MSQTGIYSYRLFETSFLPPSSGSKSLFFMNFLDLQTDATISSEILYPERIGSPPAPQIELQTSHNTNKKLIQFKNDLTREEPFYNYEVVLQITYQGWPVRTECKHLMSATNV